MYTAPEEQLSFGDIYEAEWLFDVYVRADTAAMFRRSVQGLKDPVWVVRGSATRLENEHIKVEATMEADDVVLTVGTLRMGIVLTDDCEIASLAGARDDWSCVHAHCREPPDRRSHRRRLRGRRTRDLMVRSHRSAEREMSVELLH
jgi:hypothetical protein